MPLFGATRRRGTGKDRKKGGEEAERRERAGGRGRRGQQALSCVSVNQQEPAGRVEPKRKVIQSPPQYAARQSPQIRGSGAQHTPEPKEYAKLMATPALKENTVRRTPGPDRKRGRGGGRRGEEEGERRRGGEERGEEEESNKM